MRNVVLSLSLVGGLCFVGHGFTAPLPTNQGTTSYAAIGVVEKISPDLASVTIHHHAIPGYMMEMTMDFPIRNTNELAGVSPNDEITFTLVVSTNDDWVEHIRRTGHTTTPATNVLSLPSAMAQMALPAELGPGDLLPDYTLTTEQGKPIRFSDFRGQALAFTFFFTRCPLPDYCPRMNQDFAETRRLLLADTNAPANWQLLCISFDPGFDTPEVLSDYASLYRGADSSRWLFATASGPTLHDLAASLDLIVTRQGNNISHNLRTVVLDPAGRIFRQLDGNEWTAAELASALTNAARLKSAAK
jgi:protein SCO1/2